MNTRLQKIIFMLGTLGAISCAHALDIQISAPVFSTTDTISNYSGDNYPTNQLDVIKDIIDNNFVTYNDLFDRCKDDPKYQDKIQSSENSTALTAQQLASNYKLIAECAYEKYLIKPYYLPKMVADVDICAQKMPKGVGWRMINEEDILGWNEDVYAQLSAALNSAWPASDITFNFGRFYFSSATYIRSGDTLKVGALYSHLSTEERVVAVPPPDAQCTVPGTCAVTQAKLTLRDADGNQTQEFVPVTLRCIKVNSSN